MLLTELLTLYDRDLKALRNEIESYLIKIFDEEKTISFIFIHLETHIAYHLGQINYHRRILATNTAS
jgi:hypothetical protein